MRSIGIILLQPGGGASVYCNVFSQKKRKTGENRLCRELESFIIKAVKNKRSGASERSDIAVGQPREEEDSTVGRL